ncbi:hypothetical protein EM595_2363 [Duffyella gerundensis]|uniref:Uncharacterized protein n=1 Tax=Duffyella gerundensis TaxID=1619313 RepID=A0A0U5GNE2_9GAMM|nr:hypothetical protein EM595_2363 [Duffyella gerundensis]
MQMNRFTARQDQTLVMAVMAGCALCPDAYGQSGGPDD